jgi:hypothetical protein
MIYIFVVSTADLYTTDTKTVLVSSGAVSKKASTAPANTTFLRTVESEKMQPK